MQRIALTVQGIVQGVGFRPFVHELATRLQLAGFVRNGGGSLQMEVEGEDSSLEQFLSELRNQPPPLSRVEYLEWKWVPVRNETAFRIEQSDTESQSSVFISPDVATCQDCLNELFDPHDRRYRYPFLNCTNCGPRLTIIQRAPYDRERTTMAPFVLCAECRREYQDPTNRRFHAQPIACPTCGPHLEAIVHGERIDDVDPLSVFVKIILGGGIGALKGLGGYHLVCNACDSQAVRELRQRKQRDEKPFAIMLRNSEEARTFCSINAQEQQLLESSRRPIVLLRKHSSLSQVEVLIADDLAPGNPSIGVMLPYTPLHHLLMEAVEGLPLVMTSGNQSDEPIAYEDQDAFNRLDTIVDVTLTHNRPIHVRCEDSVTRIVDDQELRIRRSRGDAPQPIKLPVQCPLPILAVGGQLKNVFALGRNQQAFLSHHLGDLDHFATWQAFERDVRLYENLFDLRPRLIVHDLHPDYASTRYARKRAAEEGLPLLGVQHHHAHLASCMAEHGLDEPVIGICFDGTGYGLDETIWGGEFLVGDYAKFVRATYLRYVRLPGGDKAVREPWRIGLAHLRDAEWGNGQFANVSPSAQRTVEQMIERGVNSPFTSSAGRLFDAVAAIARVRTHVSYEGQAAIELEWLATDAPEQGHYPFEISDTIDTRPMVRAVAHDVQQGTQLEVVARRFHSTLVEIISTVCQRIRTQMQISQVVLSGGVFLNALLTREVCARLRSENFHVYRHHQVPPGDGGLSLGQLAIAARMLISTDREQVQEKPSRTLSPIM